MIWQFTLQYKQNTIKVSEPVNFDSVEFSLKRDLKTHGMLFEFSTNCSFYKEARQFILNALYNENINAEIKIYIEYLAPNEQNYRLFYQGLLALRDIEITDTLATIKIENDSFLRKFNSKKDLDVSIKPNLFNVELHSKTIRQKSLWEYDNLFSNITKEINNAVTGVVKRNNYLFPLSNVASELQNIYSISQFTFNNITGTDTPIQGDLELTQPYIVFQNTGQVKLKGKLKNSFKISANFSVTGSAILNIILHYQVANSYDYGDRVQIYQTGFFNISNGETIVKTIENTFDLSFSANAGQALYFYFTVYHAVQGSGGNIGNFPTTITALEGSYFEVSQDTQNLPTLHQGVTVFEAFKQIVDNYTNEGARFKSNYFQYGCGANRMLTNGFWLRQLNDKEFFTNFKYLFESVQSIDNLGLSIYKENGVNIVRIEPMEYFYKAELLQNFQYPSDLKITLFSEMYANKINVGYEKWNNDAIGQVNGLDEFNANMQFATKVESANFFDNEGLRNEFNFVSKIISSGYLIEYVRRQIGKETTDSQYDNDTFIICLNDSNTKSERNENFELVENIIDPATAYNLRISPKRNLLNFAPNIAAQLIKGNAQLREVVFRSGQGNFKMQTKSIADCLQSDKIIENENFELLENIAIFEAEIYTFSYPLTFTKYQDILNNPNAVIELQFEKTKFAGFLIDLNYRPNQGIGYFKLLKCLLEYAGARLFEFQDGQIYEFQDGQQKQFQDQ